jgi:hypothetical protein
MREITHFGRWTGNVAGVSLNDKYGGMEIGEIGIDEANL